MAANPNRPGRPKGSANQNVPNIKALAGRYSNMCIEQLVKIAQKSKFEGNRLAAINMLLDRAHGKPTQAIATEDDKPIGLVIRWEK